MADLAAAVAAALDAAAPLRGQGRVASYIPALASVDPRKMGIAVAAADGSVMCAGDADEPFSIQSISKIFMLSLALGYHGPSLWDRVGREPSGSAFNSIVQLEVERGKPRNPLINAGALVVTDAVVDAAGSDAAVDLLLAHLSQRAGEPITFDSVVAASESDAGALNRSLANFLAAFGNLRQPVEAVLSAYFRQCAVAMSCRQLARAGLHLAFEGRDPVSGEQIIPPERSRRIGALMLTCGHYDNSGDFAFRVGLPGKSGVGGGILVVAPGHGAICAWSPGLNAAGTSLVGAAMLEHLVERTGWSVFS